MEIEQAGCAVNSGWTDERVATLLRMQEEGASGPEIARALGVTRNTVIGKLARLHRRVRKGLPLTFESRPRKKTPVESPRTLPKAPKDAARPQQAPTRKRGDLPPLGPPSPKTLLELQLGDCRWPEGDPRRAGFHFCGRKTEHGPYCPHHTARAHQTEVLS